MAVLLQRANIGPRFLPSNDPYMGSLGQSYYPGSARTTYIKKSFRSGSAQILHTWASEPTVQGRFATTALYSILPGPGQVCNLSPVQYTLLGQGRFATTPLSSVLPGQVCNHCPVQYTTRVGLQSLPSLAHWHNILPGPGQVCNLFPIYSLLLQYTMIAFLVQVFLYLGCVLLPFYERNFLAKCPLFRKFRCPLQRTFVGGGTEIIPHTPIF